MKEVIKTFLVIFIFIFIFYPDKKPTNPPPQKPIKDNSFIGQKYFVACSPESKEDNFSIDKTLSASLVLVEFLEKGKVNFENAQEALMLLSCSLMINHPNLWPHLEDSGYKIIETNLVKDTGTYSDRIFQVCEILDDKNKTFYVLGKCP